jgi:vacuolar-type H+-ATPase subunit F/Vma7
VQITYIGEEITAQGFALLGIDSLQPAAEHAEVIEALQTARNGSDLVLLDQGLATLVHTELQTFVLQHPVPPILVVPAMTKNEDLHSAELELARHELGIEI